MADPDPWADFRLKTAALPPPGADPWADFRKPAAPDAGVISPSMPTVAAPVTSPESVTQGVQVGAGDWSKTLGNVPQSAWNFVKGVAQPFIHPVDTGKALLGVADALGSKISRPGDLQLDPSLGIGRTPAATPEELQARAQREAPANAVGDFLVNRYGGLENIKKTIVTDPVGFAADVSTLLTAGSTAPTRAAPLLREAGAVFDPLTQAGNVAKIGSNLAGKAVSEGLGFTTGAGGSAVRTAASAGREGGEAGVAFRENMRGAPVTGLVDRAKSALDEVRQDRSAAYQAGKADLTKDTTVLDFGKIDTAIDKASGVAEFRGRTGTAPAVTTEPKAAGVVGEMSDLVKAWKALDPAEYHTPVGMDALKRTLGNIKDSTQYGTPERVAADRIYNAVRGEVANQAPGYSKMMEGYGGASEKIKEIERTLSLGERASEDTGARKLLSVMRDNVQTNYGKRGELIAQLAEKDPTLVPSIAGQTFKAPLPRGLVSRLLGGGGAGAVATGAINPWALAGAPAFSPRLVGEATHLGGRAAGLAERLAPTAADIRSLEQGAFQSGRLSDVEMRRQLAQVLMRGNEQRAR